MNTKSTLHGLIAAAIYLWGSGASSASADSPPPQKYTGPRCIGGFCFDDKEMPSLETFVNRYGQPAMANGVYCFRVPNQDLYVRFETSHVKPAEIDGIFISRKQNCLKSFSETIQPKIEFLPFVTPEGIGVGDSYSKIVAAYGPPTHVERGTGLELRGLAYKKALKAAPFGDTVLIYSGSGDELLSVTFYFQNGKVSAISLSASE